MFCQKCGVQNTDVARFCLNCGAAMEQQPQAPIQQPQYQQQQYQGDLMQPPQHAQPMQKTKKKKGCLILILVVLGIVVSLFVLAALNGGEVSFSTANVKDAYMASEINLDTAEPIVKTDTFSQSTRIIYVTAYIKNVPGNVAVSTVWTYLPTGEGMNSEKTILNRDAQVQFNVSMPNGFLPGDYKVEILIDEKVKETLSFSVK